MYEGQSSCSTSSLHGLARTCAPVRGLASLIGRLLGSAASVAEDQAPIFPSDSLR
ncbi:hypothetical protein V8C34DRAFT_282237 [Trichoderma compactum]